jgi:hypothetical protein
MGFWRKWRTSWQGGSEFINPRGGGGGGGGGGFTFGENSKRFPVRWYWGGAQVSFGKLVYCVSPYATRGFGYSPSSKFQLGFVRKMVMKLLGRTRCPLEIGDCFQVWCSER